MRGQVEMNICPGIFHGFSASLCYISNLAYWLSELIQAQCLGVSEEGDTYCFLFPRINARILSGTIQSDTNSAGE